MNFLGCPLESLTALNSTNLNIPPITPSDYHEVYVTLPLEEIGVPKPFPATYTDDLDLEHVQMPNSPQSLYYEKMTDGTTNTSQRWLVIQNAFQTEIKSEEDLQRAILSYNPEYEKWKFTGLLYGLDTIFSTEEKASFFKDILPKIIKLALDLPFIVTKPIVFLKKNFRMSISLSQKQIACLLANAFLCTFPNRYSKNRHLKGGKSKYGTYPGINFIDLFEQAGDHSLNKLKCIIHYFKEVTSREMDGLVTFSRQYISDRKMPSFETSSSTFTRLHIASEGSIEEPDGLLQMDFADKYIGGYVIGMGCVQEEILFVLWPELIISRLFTEVLGDNEAIIITGAERFNEGEGYSRHFRWTRPYRDTTAKDSNKRRFCQIVAIDALNFGGRDNRRPADQYKKDFLLRELRKAYVGFKPLKGSEGKPIAVSTGNWGCGIFKGNPRLKGLLQMAAASVVGRDVAYFTFGDRDLMKDLAKAHQFLIEKSIIVGQLVTCLYQYGSKKGNGHDLIEYLYQNLSSTSIPSAFQLVKEDIKEKFSRRVRKVRKMDEDDNSDSSD